MANFKQFNKHTAGKRTWNSDQLPKSLTDIIDDQINKFESPISITTSETDEIPHTDDFPSPTSPKWLKINGPICVYVDMANSTQLSATNHSIPTAKIYQLYTNTAVMLFHELGAKYIDIKGDGVFAMFDKSKPHAALASAVTFKTFFDEIFKPRTLKLTRNKVDIGNHIGIDQHTLLVKQLGLRKYNNRTDKQNEVWAGKTVNMAAKLGSLFNDNRIVVSDRFFGNLTCSQSKFSCGCPNNKVVPLWDEHDVSSASQFDFQKAFYLGSKWCKNHGSETLRIILDADK